MPASYRRATPYIIINESHRLKNMNCVVMREFNKYSNPGRMGLTGTPLQVRSRVFLLLAPYPTGILRPSE
ncbi:putative ATP-dependent helicase IRC5 [Mycena venus]|uniref:Putative ATP-dependent helicase IRC5 n=1 Tax=Mycena venus TaxID=2733690 RepID=A0A8H7CST1_9AGAR|nr:putative ATP-dependent helicase IRC5 [Mycena venus]